MACYTRNRKVTSVIAFHEKAGRSQVNSFWFSLDKVFSLAELPLSPPLPSALGRGGNSLFQHDTPRLIQNAVAARAIPQVQTDGQLLLRKIPALLPGCSANLLHCRSPLSLVLQSTSITWERTASRRRPAFSSHLVATVDAKTRHNLGHPA